jgi:hypothetical protein
MEPSLPILSSISKEVAKEATTEGLALEETLATPIEITLLAVEERIMAEIMATLKSVQPLSKTGLIPLKCLPTMFTLKPYINEAKIINNCSHSKSKLNKCSNRHQSHRRHKLLSNHC